MDRRIDKANTASRVTKAINDAELTSASVSEATGIPMSVLDGTTPYGVSDLARAGGFLHVHPADLIGAAA